MCYGSTPLIGEPSPVVCYLPHGCRRASDTPIMITGIVIAANIAIVIMLCMCVLYQIRRSASSVPAWVDVVRSSFEGDNPPIDLLEPSVPLAAHSRCEGDTGVSVVNLFTAEALIASHEFGNAHVTTGTVVLSRLVLYCVGCCLLVQLQGAGVYLFSIKSCRF